MRAHLRSTRRAAVGAALAAAVSTLVVLVGVGVGVGSAAEAPLPLGSSRGPLVTSTPTAEPATEPTVTPTTAPGTGTSTPARILPRLGDTVPTAASADIPPSAAETVAPPPATTEPPPGTEPPSPADAPADTARVPVNASGSGLVQGTPCTPTARACVNLVAQTAWLFDNGSIVRGPVNVMIGDEMDPTPRGTFHVEWKAREWTSREYLTQMPYAVFFADGGIAFHEGSQDTNSAGCVKLSHEDAVTWFDYLQVGDEVQIR